MRILGITTRDSLKSHQAGATLSTLSGQIMALMATPRVPMINHEANEQTPTFQAWNMDFDSEASTSMHAIRLAVGTRGNVGSISRLPIVNSDYIEARRERSI